ncbi:MAG: cytoskeletal protein RodZ [Elusimicrobia bacterium ADurb.Bin231]|nr:MAG: cytoskeletal protein RodZ [Elusimicrobia bacterium ADurb.Bin231]
MNTEKTIGQRFKEAREKKGISVEEVSKKTLINRDYLIAIEEDRICDIPAPVFAIGSIRNYAKFLNLDAEQLVEESKHIYPVKPLDKPLDLQQTKILSLRKKSEKEKYLYYAILTAIFILLVFAGFVTFKIISAAPKKNYKTESAERRAKNILVLKTTQDVWVKIRSDNKTIFEGVLPPNTNKRFELENKASIRIGNIPGIRIIYNGHLMEVPKQIPGRVGEITLK